MKTEMVNSEKQLFMGWNIDHLNTCLDVGGVSAKVVSHSPLHRDCRSLEL